MSSLFEIDHLDVFFESVHALHDISFGVNAGEFLGIIGPNGSGKSTLLRSMAGAIRPSSGRVTLDGRNIVELAGRERAARLAVIPQESPISFQYTVLQIVLMGRSPHLGRFRMESERDIEVANLALERTGLLDLADRHIGELSGGERQRVMIARALAQETEILFLDEPTAHLDINYQVEVLQLARRENREHKKTIVAVLHDLNLAAEFCDRLILLRGGSLFASGTPEEVVTAQNVLAAYGASVWVRKHPTSGRPYMLSIGSRGIAAKLVEHGRGSRAFVVHVICGGGSGAPVFTQLLQAGCAVTAGVINIGDTDQEAAETLGIEYVEDAPFSPISEAARLANLDFVEDADAVIVAETPFGSGNISNLHSAVHALDLGKPVAVVGKRESYKERDFLGGEAKPILDALIERGAAVIETPDGVLGWLAKTREV
jgi:iron complex transport system ATP-binding protein